MIFQRTYPLVLSRRKTQTLRLAYPGDYLTSDRDTEGSVLLATQRVVTAAGRVRWRIGGEYAVQPERCHKAVGRIRCIGLTEILNPLTVDDAFVDREGFDERADYLRIWHELHARKPVQRAWAIRFELVRSKQRRSVA
ncbi:MAG TPA: hypothetical protein VGN72_04995 [Tepidisphaeraceae bacterium]|jgi:hypothetical protein|nr:hypothetical protein [Tepidisphaeraceae bacterium]